MVVSTLGGPQDENVCASVRSRAAEALNFISPSDLSKFSCFSQELGDGGTGRNIFSKAGSQALFFK